MLAHIEGMSSFDKYFGRNYSGGFLESGSVGVDLFFVLSGFIISYVSLAENTLAPTISVNGFLRNRFVRIIPFMWVCILGYAALRMLGRGSFPFDSYLRALILFPVGPVQPNQIWTLRYELLFYLLFCLTMIRERNLWQIMLIWFICPFLYPFSKGDSWISQLGYFLFGDFNYLFGFGFLIGILYKKGYLRYSVNVRNGFLIMLLLTIPLLFICNTFDNSHVINGVYCSFLLLMAICMNDAQINVLNRFGLLLGKWSFAIYLTHPAIISSILGIWSKVDSGANLLIVMVVITLLSIAAGGLASLLIEEPLIKYTKRILFKRKAELINT